MFSRRQPVSTSLECDIRHRCEDETAFEGFTDDSYNLKQNEILSEEITQIPDIKNEDSQASSTREVYEKFESFKRDSTKALTTKQKKKRIKESIYLWTELFKMINNINKNNKKLFDHYRNVLTKAFSDVLTSDILSNDSEFSRRIFFDYLDIINMTENLEYFTKTSTETLADGIRESCLYITSLSLSSICGLVHFTEDDISDKYHPLLNSIKIFIERNIQLDKPMADAKTASEYLHMRLLSLIWNLSDRTIIVPSLLRIGFGKSVINWMNYSCQKEHELRPIVSIVHNLSRHDDGADELNKWNTIETLLRLQQLKSAPGAEIELISTMALALLSTPEQIKADPARTKNILDKLLQITIKASTSDKRRYSGFHISEPLVVLVKLFVDDSTFDYVMNHAKTDPPSNSTSIIKMFSDLICEFHQNFRENNRLIQFTFRALLNILWSISFHEAYHEILKHNNQLITTITNVAKEKDETIDEQYVSRSMQNVKKAADGILFNLGIDISVDTVPIIAPAQPSQQKPLVMISYSHANMEFCDKILQILDENSNLFDVWVDKRFCKSSSDVWELIAKAIKNAELIICIISTEYMASKACRQEIIYAKDRLNKRFLPVYMEKPEVSDWLDIRLAEFKYVRFQDTHTQLNKRKIDEFRSTVIESVVPGHLKSDNSTIIRHHNSSNDHKITKGQGKSTNNRLSAAGPTKKLNISNKPVMEWAQDDIDQWFQANHINFEIYELYQFKTGAQMITYADCFKDGWEKQYERYARRYTQRFPGQELPEHEFILFSTSLQQLARDSQQSSNKTDLINPKTSKKSSFCVLF